MLTRFILSINWVDVALAVLLVRVVFIGVKNGFIAEVFKLFGVFCALLVSLHWYSRAAAFLASKMPLPEGSWEFISFVFLLSTVVVAVKFVREGFLVLFQVSTNSQGFDKYAGGILAILRAVWLCSLIIFALLLINQEYVAKQTRHSWARKTMGTAAVVTYRGVFHYFVGRLFPEAHYNDAAEDVIRLHVKEERR